MRKTILSRRQFLKSAGALVVGFNLLPAEGRLSAQPIRLPDGDLDPRFLDSWLAVDRNGIVTVYTSKVELGTGTLTALAQIVAEELDVELRQIDMKTGDTERTIEQGSTVGSRTIERGGPQLRQAAAAARQALLKLASTRLKTSVARLAVRSGTVRIVGNPAKKISYGQLIGGKYFNTRITATGRGWNMKVAPEVRAKDPKDYRIVGTSARRLDLPAKLTGEHFYTQDLRLPGMLHGRVVRPPVVNTEPINIDENSIRHIRGIVKVVHEGKFVGVVAKTEWAAIQAAQSLKVTWSKPTVKMPANRDQLFAYLKDNKPVRALKAVDQGDLSTAFNQAKKIYEGRYRWPFQMHGMIGPSCAIAHVKGTKATIWSGPQGPFRTRGTVAKLLKIPERNVRVIYSEASGCYGRMSTDDGAEDAALLSRAVGAPVRVQWMRHDEHGWEPKGPAQLDEIKAAVDGDNKLIGWDFVDYGFPWTASGSTPLLASLQTGLKPSNPGFSNGTQSGGEIYGIANQKIVAAQLNWHFAEPIPLRTSNLRAPGDVARCFASESLMDEIAADLKTDPVEFRLRHLTNNPRGTECLKAAADKAQWRARSPASTASGNLATGRGVAMTQRANAYVATVAEIEVNRATGKIAVKRIVCAHDCGLIVNPDGVKNQAEGNIVQGVSRALLEEVAFDSHGVTSLDWSSYPILKFSDVPEIEIVLIDRPEMQALGAGEPATIPLPAAIANAIFDAVGVRLREGPFTPKRVLEELKRA